MTDIREQLLKWTLYRAGCGETESARMLLGQCAQYLSVGILPPATVRHWLAMALNDIAKGGDANKILMVKRDRGRATIDNLDRDRDLAAAIDQMLLETREDGEHKYRYRDNAIDALLQELSDAELDPGVLKIGKSDLQKIHNRWGDVKDRN